MADTAEADAEPAKKKKGKGLLIGLILALLLGGGGFYGVYSGLIPLPFGGGETEEHAAVPAHAPSPAHGADAHGGGHGDGHGGEEAGAVLPEGPEVDAAFLSLQPVIVTIGGAQARQLQMTAQLEVEPDRQAEAEMLTPRAHDALTTYLRAVDPEDVEDPASMIKMRAQMLRRLQVVMGEGVVRDLLVSEFVLR